jgi:hypothetical protein
VTISHQWKRWKDPRLVFMVLHNSDLNMVTWEQRISAGDPKFEDSQVLPRFPYAEYARMLGLQGIKVEQPDAPNRSGPTGRRSPLAAPCTCASTISPTRRRCGATPITPA